VAKSSDRIAAEFLAWYTGGQAERQLAAVALQRYVGQVLADSNLRPMVVTARAKTLESVRSKLLRKPYKNPRAQLTDRLGVRVILYHAREVDAVAKLLRSKVQVREADSLDKRLALGPREFGYRSIHIVGSLPSAMTAAPQFRSLGKQIFEIQIRSLLEHVWAEIEHEVVYKSGANWPVRTKRRFAAIAAVLELLEHDFDQLEESAGRLVDEAHAALLQRMDARRPLDVPTMYALLEILRPEGLSFRDSRTAGSPFPPGIDQLLLLAFRRLRMNTVGALQRSLVTGRMRKIIRRYATSEGISPDQVSHLALLTLLVATRAPATFRVFFPEIAGDDSLRTAVA
jgi:ppGpp synthetase/RelA/SpoT-type nucleotidyltranferase